MTSYCMSAAPLWSQVGDLHSLWVNHQPPGQSVRLSLFLKQLSDAVEIGLLKVDVAENAYAVETGNCVVLAEWRLAGNLDAFRAALKAPQCDVHSASLDNSVEVAK